jgi:hypothetical protein
MGSLTGRRHSSASASTGPESMPETWEIVHLTSQTTPANWNTRSMTARAGVGDDTALPRNSR